LKLIIDNHDGDGPIDYTAAIVAEQPFRMVRRLNQPSTCVVSIFPGHGVVTPVRNARMIVANDDGTLLFTGYIVTEPAMEFVGRGTEGFVWQAAVSAISDEILLNQQALPGLATICGASSGEALQAMLAAIRFGNISYDLSQSNLNVSQFQPRESGTWSENAGELAASVRSAYRLMNGSLTLLPVGSITHSLNESDGTLSLRGLAMSRVRALANDVTVCGETEPCVYVTEFFQADGTSVLFNLSERPWMPAASKSKPLTDNFQGPTIDTRIWNVEDPGAALALTSAGLICGGGGSSIGATVVSAISSLEMGGGFVAEAGGVQFGANTSGILNGFFTAGQATVISCIAGFLIGQANGATTISPLVNGAIAGSTFTAAAGHLYALRLRFSSNEVQRVLQAYYTVAPDIGLERFGADLLGAAANIIFEVQDTTNGIASTPVVLYSGEFTSPPAPWCLFAPLVAGYLQCSLGDVSVERQGPVWVTTTSANGTPAVCRIGTPAQGADCAINGDGMLQFYPLSTPKAGDVIAVSYRTRRRSVARLANASSIDAESNGGALPGTACWAGTVTRPAPRSSADCENAAAAILAVSTDRAAAWKGTYSEWNADEQGDVWPGDQLAITSPSAGLSTSLVVREVQIEMLSGAPVRTKYAISFANDWAEEISIQTSSTVPADAWLAQQPEAATPLANLIALAVTSITGSAIQIDAGVTPPSGGGFEVRRRDWSFAAGSGPDLVLRSPVPNFIIPRQATIERYYIRMYDGSTPPNYSRFSSAVFVNLPLTHS
jgi:hypothetical protein